MLLCKLLEGHCRTLSFFSDKRYASGEHLTDYFLQRVKTISREHPIRYSHRVRSKRNILHRMYLFTQSFFIFFFLLKIGPFPVIAFEVNYCLNGKKKKAIMIHWYQQFLLNSFRYKSVTVTGPFYN